MFHRLWNWTKLHPTRAMRVSAFLLFFGVFAHQIATALIVAQVRPSIKGHTLAEIQKIFRTRDMTVEIATAFDAVCLTAAIILAVCGIWRRRRGLP